MLLSVSCDCFGDNLLSVSKVQIDKITLLRVILFYSFKNITSGLGLCVSFDRAFSKICVNLTANVKSYTLSIFTCPKYNDKA